MAPVACKSHAKHGCTRTMGAGTDYERRARTNGCASRRAQAAACLPGSTVNASARCASTRSECDSATVAADGG